MDTTETQTERIIISEQKELREKMVAAAEEMLAPLSNAHQAAKAVFGLSMPLDIIWEQAKEPMSYAERFTRLFLYEQNQKLKQMPIPVDQALAFVVLPAEFAAYRQALEELNKFQKRISYRYVKETPTEYFSVENGELVLNEQFYKNLDARTRRYSSASEAELIKEFSEVFDKINNLQKRFPSARIVASFSEDKPTNPIFWQGSGSGRLYLNERAIAGLTTEE